MSDRLTDDKVAMYVDMGNYPATSCANDDVIALAREVQEYRALRPTCPTCNGKPTGSIRECSNGFGGYYDCCPDCEDGKMPLVEWVALLVEDSKRLAKAIKHPDHCPASYGPMHRCECGARSALDAHAAVLKMAGKS